MLVQKWKQFDRWTTAHPLKSAVLITAVYGINTYGWWKYSHFASGIWVGVILLAWLVILTETRKRKDGT